MQSMLARLRGMVEALKTIEEEPSAASAHQPSADQGDVPVPQSGDPEPPPRGQALPTVAADLRAAGEASAEAIPLAEPVEPPEADLPEEVCPSCQAPQRSRLSYCDNCGLIFRKEDAVPNPTSLKAAPGVRLKDRYELGEEYDRRGEVQRFRGSDHGAGTAEPVPVILVRAAAALPQDALPVENADDGEDILPACDDPEWSSQPATEPLPPPAVWPSLAWEDAVLEKASHPFLPAVLDRFCEGQWEYLVEEIPPGRPLWDAWDDPAAAAEERFGWLKQLAGGLHQLHQASAILEALRPEQVVITADGRARLRDLADLLPLPLPPHALLRVTLYTAPELVLTPETVDARADLYAFGALLYSLHVGRELTETDFERPGTPKAFMSLFPDVHPALGRLLSKIFCRERGRRFPTDEAGGEDATGFADLVRALETCRRALDGVRLEVAAWTTTGMVRTANEDAFAVLHAVESKPDDLDESALVLVADGMGGSEAGEVAAALAIQALRKNLLRHPPFASLGATAPLSRGAFETAACRERIADALREANREILAAAQSGAGRPGMGCTAEVAYLSSGHLIVGHVGDSRTYHLHNGRLTQLTRDQTLVNRLVELGTLSPEEAEKHPRRAELQQALGGRGDVDVLLYDACLKPGDWVVVCSDGLSNAVTPTELQQMLLCEATSAEMAARRLVNLANIKGATDNATVVVVRAS